MSWASQGDEWVFHLCGALGLRHLPGKGSYSDRTVIVGPADETLPSTLRARPDPYGIRCTVADDGDEAHEDQIQRWREAVARAATELGRHDQDFRWQAVLGPNPRRRDRWESRPFPGSVRLGPVLIEPGGIQMREWVGSGPAEISEYKAADSWPVIASGTVRTYDHTAADILVKFRVHRTCALLTLFCGPHWLARVGPHAYDARWPIPPIQVPQSVGEREHSEPGSSLLADCNGYDSDDPLWLPAWADDAWDLLNDDPVLATAVSAHCEASSLEYDHPSAAFLGYVAAIEGIGSKLVELTECEKCKSQKGAGRRFREALKTVLTPKEVRELAWAYDVRSRTGHSGALFGTEETLGCPRISLFEYDSRFVFDIRLLGQIRRASSRVVTRALMNALGVDAPNA